MTSPIPFLGAFGGGQSPSFNAPLITTLVPNSSGGDSTPTYTRATTAYVTDFEGLLKQVPSGCARFTGARVVQNLCPTPSTSIAVSGNKTITVGVGTFVFSMGAEATGTSTITFTGTATGSTGSLVANSTKRTAKTLTITAGGTIIATCTNAPAVDIQFENVTGQSNQNPAEYVSVGVLSAPYHGAGVDGVKYFDTENGNTVASNVVTEATGAAIADATLKGYLAEGSRQNRCLSSQDFTDPVWVSGGGGIAVTPNTEVAPDGTTTADTLTASGANGTLIQDLGVVASADKAGGLYLKRKTGTGNIDLTLDGGATWTTVAVTSSWLPLEKTQTLADEDFGIRIVTSGDAVYAWQSQVETAAFISSPIPTTTAAVTRNTDLLVYPVTGNIGAAEGAAYCEGDKKAIPNGGTHAFVILGGSGTRYLMYNNGSDFQTVSAYDGTNLSVITETSMIGVQKKIAMTWSASNNRLAITMSGLTPNTTAFVGDMVSGSTTINIGGAATFGNRRNVKIWQRAKTDAQLQALTT